MSIHTGISRSAGQTLIIPVRDMLVGLCISIAFSKAKIYKVYKGGSFPNADEEVIRLDIPMNEVFRMDVLNSS